MHFSKLNAYLSRLPRSKIEFEKLWVDNDGRVQGQFFNCALTSQFQPVRTLEGYIRAFDAHAHSYSKEDTGLSVWRMLNNAASDDESIELDRLCRMLHVLNFFRQAEHFDDSLLIGVHERLLAAVSSNHGVVFRRILDGLELPIERILLQLPHVHPDRHWMIGFVIENYRRNGFRIATHASSANEAAEHLEQVRPDLIRIDSYAPGEAERLANVVEHADALDTTLLFARVDRESDLSVISTALELSGTTLTERLWVTGALAGQSWASLGDVREPSNYLSPRAVREASAITPQT